ncbi:MAG TPA: AAA family ATPase [Acidimicrobiia bacterium]|nr:AAA family ATPase [Acidimicrobiia bacterium]
MPATPELQAALDALYAIDANARAEAAAVCAVVSRKSPGAPAAWANAFDRHESEFVGAAELGAEWVTRPAPGVSTRLATSGATTGGTAIDYARALADLAIAAAALGDLTVSAIGTATVLGNTQLVAAGARLPDPTLFAPHTPGPPTASGGAPDAQQTAAVATAEEPKPEEKPEPPPKTLDELLAELDGLVGLEAIKTEIHHQTQVLRVQGLRAAAGLKIPDMTRHLVFVGNPGTGKTTVARLVAGIYRAIGVLPKGHLVECDRSELVAGYVGQTAIKTAEVIDSAVGGCLFIDEAYGLAHDDFGHEAIDTLVKGMEDHRDELLVIVAGYPEPMQRFISSNPGLESRFRLTMNFEDYTDDELVEIFSRIAAASDFSPQEATVTRLREILAETPRGEGFGNGRFVRTMFESAVVRQAWRLRDVTAPDVEQLRDLTPEDLAEMPEDPEQVPEAEAGTS